MSFLKRLFRRDRERPTSVEEQSEPPCPHVLLIPYWDSTDDIGNQESVARYTCESCKAAFSFEEGERLRAEEAERVRLLTTEGSEDQQKAS